MRSLFLFSCLVSSLVAAPVAPSDSSKTEPAKVEPSVKEAVTPSLAKEKKESPSDAEKKEAPSTSTQTEKEYKIPDGKSIPTIEKIDANNVKLGDVTINHKERTLSFPAFVNLKEGLIEYMISMPHGKLHECLFISTADPLHISVGAKLLKWPFVKGLFPERDDNMQWLPYNPPKRDSYKKALVDITASWEKDGKTTTKRVSDLIKYKSGPQKLSGTEWALVDSSLYKGCYQASVIGDIVAIFGDPNSFISYTGFANNGENVWLADPAIIPDPGTKVTITLKQLPEEEAEKPLLTRPADPGNANDQEEALIF